METTSSSVWGGSNSDCLFLHNVDESDDVDESILSISRNRLERRKQQSHFSNIESLISCDFALNRICSQKHQDQLFGIDDTIPPNHSKPTTMATTHCTPSICSRIYNPTKSALNRTLSAMAFKSITRQNRAIKQIITAIFCWTNC